MADSIQRIDIFSHDVTYAYGTYEMSRGRVIRTLSSTVVRLVSKAGVEGFGEACPLGSNYLASFVGGVRAALMELCPVLIGMDVGNVSEINAVMDSTLTGERQAKSAIDVACWDATGRILGRPVFALLGGRRQEKIPLYVAIPKRSATETVEFVAVRKAEGISRFQLKVGSQPDEDADRVRRVREVVAPEDVIVADANGGWCLQDAVLASRLLEPLDHVYLEQPCRTLDECVALRARTSLPFILDEAITDVPSLLRAYEANGMEAINLKIGRVGGLTKAKVLRDLAEALGLRLTIEDTWGGDIATAAISQLAASTSSDALFSASYMNDWVVNHVANHVPVSERGFGLVPHGDGLGISVDPKMLGAPLATFQG